MPQLKISTSIIEASSYAAFERYTFHSPKMDKHRQCTVGTCEYVDSLAATPQHYFGRKTFIYDATQEVTCCVCMSVAATSNT